MYDRVPLFIQNVEALKKLNRIPDEIEFLRETVKTADQLEHNLSRYESIEQVPSWYQQQLVEFYKTYVGLLNSTKDFPAQEFMHAEHLDQIESTIRDPKRVRAVLDKAFEDIRDGARLLDKTHRCDIKRV